MRSLVPSLLYHLSWLLPYATLADPLKGAVGLGRREVEYWEKWVNGAEDITMNYSSAPCEYNNVPGLGKVEIPFLQEELNLELDLTCQIKLTINIT